MTPKTPTWLALWRASSGTEHVPLGKPDVLPRGETGLFQKKAPIARLNTCKTRPPQQRCASTQEGPGREHKNWGGRDVSKQHTGVGPGTRSWRACALMRGFVCESDLCACELFACLYVRTCAWKGLTVPSLNFNSHFSGQSRLYLSVQKAVLASGESVINVEFPHRHFIV